MPAVIPVNSGLGPYNDCFPNSNANAICETIPDAGYRRICACDTQSQCTRCAPGTHAVSAGSMVCTNCSSGQFALEGSSSCTDCQAGLTPTGSKGDCVQCAAGHFSPAAGTQDCLQCEAGHYSLEGATSCVACQAGSANALAGQVNVSACVPCVAGHYSSSSRAGACTACAAGQFATAGSSSCIDCVAGLKPKDDQLTARSARQVSTLSLLARPRAQHVWRASTH